MNYIIVTGNFIKGRITGLTPYSQKWILGVLVGLCLLFAITLTKKQPVKILQPLLTAEETAQVFIEDMGEIKTVAKKKAAKLADNDVPIKKPNCDGLESSMLWKWINCK